jgi:hypothetical protein
MENQNQRNIKPKQARQVVCARPVGARKLFRRNIKFARQRWGSLTQVSVRALAELTQQYCLSVEAGHLQIIDGRWYVTHSGLLRVASTRRCAGIKTDLQQHVSDPTANRWIFRAVIYKSVKSKGFVGYGDADPSNVSSLVRGSELRIAETRAVNRALRKAYGIGICSVEELGSSASADPAPKSAQNNLQHHNGSNNGQPLLRDQLCILIRQHNLDATLVKAYAADFCGTSTLSGASRELVESFISHLSAAAKENRDGLICKLNSYAHPAQVNQ